MGDWKGDRDSSPKKCDDSKCNFEGTKTCVYGLSGEYDGPLGLKVVELHHVATKSPLPSQQLHPPLPFRRERTTVAKPL